MRIIAGSARGRKIEAPQGDITRPTHDRVREAVFSMLGTYFDNACALDLFAGSGALGLEAVSRGVSECVFCDRDKNALRVLKRNIRTLGFEKECRILPMTWQQALISLSGKAFDLVFLDPPYEAGYMTPALTQILRLGLLKPNGRAVCEIRAGADIEIPCGYEEIKRRSYGMAQVILLENELA